MSASVLGLSENRKRTRSILDDDYLFLFKRESNSHEAHYSRSLIGNLESASDSSSRIRTLSTQSVYIPQPSVLSQLERMGFLRNRRHSLKDVLFSPKITFAFRNNDNGFTNGIRGLMNLGNTCYMAASLQALSNCPPIRDYFCLLNDDFKNLPTNSTNNVSVAFQDLLNRLWIEDVHTPIKPTNFLFQVRTKCAQFRGFGQQDSQEFIRCFLDVLHNELKTPIEDKPLPSPSSLSSTSGDDVNSEGVDSGMSTENESSINAKEESSKNVEQETDDEEKANCSSTEDSLLKTKQVKEQVEEKEKVENKEDKGPAVKVNYESVVSVVFDGQLVSTVKCLQCQHLSHTTETFQDISLSIPSVEQLEKMKEAFEEADIDSPQAIKPNSYSYVYWLYSFTNKWVIQPWFSWVSNFYRYMFSGSVSLEDCLCAFFAADYLRGDDMYSCEKCEKLRNGVKQCRLKSLPEILCIHLKRFRHDTLYNTKINTRITFPLRDLDLQPYMQVNDEGENVEEDKNEQNFMYDLISIVSHRGSSVDFGHYIAYCQNQLDGKWYVFDDSFVSQVSETDVEAAEAYVLFYQKRSLAMFEEIDDF